jgi:hypothetical protein
MPQRVSADVVFLAFGRPNNAAELFLHPNHVAGVNGLATPLQRRNTPLEIRQ